MPIMQMFIPLAPPKGSRYNKANMKNYFLLWIGIVYFLIVMGPNVLAQSRSTETSVFDPIKDRMKLVADDNVDLSEQNRTLRTQLVGFQLEVEKVEKEIEILDPGSVRKMRYLREQGKMSLPQSLHDLEKSNDIALIEEAQELFLSGQHMDLGEEQKLRELQLYDLQYQKQELELDLEDRQALHRKLEPQRQQEIQALKIAIQENTKEEEHLYQRVAAMERKLAVYPQDISLLKMENETLKKRIKQLRKLLSQ